MRLRLRFTKLGRVRFVSHRDVARLFERALRRADLPMRYTEGFTPRPRIGFGLGLPVACESVAEYLDVALREPVDIGEVPASLSRQLPAGMDVVAAGEAPSSSLQQQVTSCTWEMEVPAGDASSLEKTLNRALGSQSLLVRRSRKGRESVDDLRPSLRSLAVGGLGLVADLSTEGRGVRPSELAEVLGLQLGRTVRTHQWIERGGSRHEPLSLAAEVPLARGRDLAVGSAQLEGPERELIHGGTDGRHAGAVAGTPDQYTGGPPGDRHNSQRGQRSLDGGSGRPRAEQRGLLRPRTVQREREVRAGELAG
jgi:radical SAM-linked protein